MARGAIDRIHEIIRICPLITDTTLGPVMTTLTPNMRVIAFCCTRQAEPLILTATHQKFDLVL